jgi:hypothetical protein
VVGWSLHVTGKSITGPGTVTDVQFVVLKLQSSSRHLYCIHSAVFVSASIRERRETRMTT